MSSPATASAIMNRGKRKTAGQRMTALVGKALEDDDAFWGHDTWEENDSGNESFRDSDEDSAMKKDEFDSDFNDSEDDAEDEEVAAGQAEERELLKEERSNRQRKSAYVDVARGGRPLMQKVKGVKGRGIKRAMGDGINAGIALNFPTNMISPAVAVSSSLSIAPPMPPVVASGAVPTRPTSTNKRARKDINELGVRRTLASARERRSQTRKRDTRNTTPTYSDKSLHSSRKIKPQTGAPSRKASHHRRQYAQEELLLEAVQKTEPENKRWLLARKRVQDSADQDKDGLAAMRDKHRGKRVIQKYHSRRGCLITLTFPEMDAVPEILTRQKKTSDDSHLTNEEQHTTRNERQPTQCVITGKPARYRDPTTKQPYADAVAFRELRRRYTAGEPLVTFSTDARKASPTTKTTSSDAVLEATSSSMGGPAKSSVKGASNASSSNYPIPTASTISTLTPNQNQQPKVKSRAGDTTNTRTPKSPKSSSGFVVDLGGVPKSPGRTRTSARKWKPSEKMLQGMPVAGPASVTSTFTTTATSIPQNTVDGTGSNASTQAEQSASDTSSKRAPSLPNFSTRNGAGDNNATATLKDPNKEPTANTENKKETRKSKNSAAAKRKSANKTDTIGPVKKVPKKANGASVSTSKARPKQPQTKSSPSTGISSSASTATKTIIPIPAVSTPTNSNSILTKRATKSNEGEQMYVIAPDDSNGLKEPHYVTQSQLIMQAISDYSRVHPNTGGKQRQDSTQIPKAATK